MPGGGTPKKENKPNPFGFKVSGGTSTVTYPDSIQSLKHLRLYNHLLTPANIKADANNLFFSAKDLTYTGWYRFNVPAPGAPPTTINSTTSDEVAVYDTYPAHVLPTTYAYNGTNQVTQQNSPDGGTNRFWYDLLSRLSISQNDKQNPVNNYSYTVYDTLGRIKEVGQKNLASAGLGNPDYLSDAAITAFAAAGSNSQITHTYYDSPVPTVSGNTDGIATLPQQSNLRKRVAASTYADTQAGPVLRATYYNYDLDGNVKTLWQQVDGLYQNSSNTGLKRIDYEYDLVSGKVNTVRYQDGQPDAFYYNYGYDAGNRLTTAWSSTSALTDTLTGTYLPTGLKKMDAQYYYYLHGPLRRLELGDDNGKVQGLDYAYTLQGWLKGVNSQTLSPTADMGHDGSSVTTPAADAYGYSLGYYTNDYTPIGGSSYTAFGLKYTQAVGDITGQSLYNGNISTATTAISQINSGNPVGYTYHYDQLNRIKNLRQHTGITTWNAANIAAGYKEDFTYDGNGNILSLNRVGATAGTTDILAYQYNKNNNGRLLNNELNYLNGHGGATNMGTDQTANNYSYDQIGNLTADNQAQISNIHWSVYGKIQDMTDSANLISYTYNPAQERVSKTNKGITSWYIRDAQGNTLAIYDNAHSTTNWKEQQLYGSSRLGMWRPNVKLTDNNAVAVWDTTGGKQYELTNHLGNVLATITDKRLQHTTSGTAIDYFNPDIATAQDYYAFGALMPGRQYMFNKVYRYGFNGKENDNEVRGIGNQQNYGARISDVRIGRFLSVDPLTRSYPWYSPYQFAGNKPIWAIDLDGLEEYLSTTRLQAEAAKLGIIGNKRIGELFERVVVAALSERSVTTIANPSFNYYSNARANRNGPAGPTQVRPDLVGITGQIDPFNHEDLYNANQFFEAKATSAVMTRGYRKGQIEGMIDVLSEQSKRNKNQAAELVIVGTSDAKIGNDILEYARNKNVTIATIVAGIDDNGNIYFTDLHVVQSLNSRRASIFNIIQETIKGWFKGPFDDKKGYNLKNYTNGINGHNNSAPAPKKTDPDPPEVNDN